MILLALVVACIAWTVTNEEVFREFKDYCIPRSKDKARSVLYRKAHYLPTCQYCFSHWVAAGVLAVSGYRIPGYTGLVGFTLSLFVIVALANGYMTAYELSRQYVRLTRLRGHKLEGKI